MNGNLVAVGARRHDSASPNAGTAYLFSAETGRLLSRLEPESTAPGDQFGNACAVHGRTVFVSSARSNANGNPAGAVHRFDLSGIRLADRDLRGVCHSLANDSFGEAIDADGGLIVVGAPDAEDCLSSDGGAAYVFDAATGEMVYTLDPLGKHSSDQFGRSVAIGDGVIAVGNPLSDMVEQNGGIVHLYDADSGQPIGSLAPDGLEVGDLFGGSLDIDQGLLAVGAPFSSAVSDDAGAVFIYELSSGALVRVLGPPLGNRRNDEFGHSVKLHDGLVLVGSPHADPVLNNSGAAYVFHAATGERLHTLAAEDGFFGDEFGHSLAIRGAYIAVGAPGDFTNGAALGGSAYVFDRKSGEQIAKINSPTGAFLDRFGSSVGLDRDSVYIGMMRSAYEPGETPNRVERFDLETFSLDMTYLPTFTQPESGFGQTIAVEGDRLIVGMPNDTMYPGFGVLGGAVFVYDQATDDTCLADFNADGVVNFFDVSVFIIAHTGGDLGADFTGDGELTFFDVSGFILAYDAGCP